MQRPLVPLRTAGPTVATLLLLVACAAPIPGGLSTTGAAPVAPVATSPTAGDPGCRTGDPLANVYHPDRLRVIDACKTVTGTAAFVRHEDDGDYHLGLHLDPPYASLLNSANLSSEHGDLVVEIVPADEIGCTPGAPPRPPHGSYDYGVCTGVDIPPPAFGAHVAVTGPYVLDIDHGWMEIHPVWAIRVVGA